MNNAQASDDVFVEAREQFGHIDRVGLKLPPFQRTDPELWFAMLERSFSLSGITMDETKFSYATQGLDLESQLEVRDILINPPKLNKFDTIKSELVKRLSKTQEQRHRQLLEREELGDSKPSQFLRRLRNLSGPGMSDDLLRTLWAGRLPRAMQGILATQKKAPLDEMAELADAIAESEFPLRSVAEASPKSDMLLLQKEIAALRIEINEVRGFQNKLFVKRERAQRSRSSSRSRSNGGCCWYHRRFGKNATKCNKPCSFQSSGNVAGDC